MKYVFEIVYVYTCIPIYAYIQPRGGYQDVY